MLFAQTHRRKFLAGAAIAAAAPVLASCGATPAEAKKKFRVTKTDAQWRRKLSRAEYRILREAGTERAFSSPLDKEKR
ncbi:MAG: twin-arginine translocation signal domain-containing protein, partial [Pseudomonadota bacterium]